MPKLPKDGTDSDARDQADWPLDQITKVARELYIRFRFDDDENAAERWKDVVREAFWVFDNLDDACKEILAERSKERRATARKSDAQETLPAVVPFDEAVQYLTGEARKSRARSNFIKFLSYQAREIPFEGVLPNLSAEQERKLQTHLEKWEKEGIVRELAIEMKSRFESCWPDVRAEQNRANRSRHKSGARVPDDRNTQKIIAAVIREKNHLT